MFIVQYTHKIQVQIQIQLQLQLQQQINMLKKPSITETWEVKLN